MLQENSEQSPTAYFKTWKNMMLFTYAGIKALFGKAWDIPIDCKPLKELQEKYMASVNSIRAGVFPPGRELTMGDGRKALEEL